VASSPIGTTKEEKLIGIKNKKNCRRRLSMLAREIKVFTKETPEAFHQY